MGIEDIVLRRIAIHWVPADAVTGRDPDEVRADPSFEHLTASLRASGFTRPILVSAGGLQIIDGAHRLQAARDLGMTHIPVVELGEHEAELWLAATLLNKCNGSTGFMNAYLVLADLQAIGQLTGVGTGAGEQHPYTYP